MKDSIEMNPNPLVQYLKKPAEEFTRQDIIKYVADNNIEMINYRYVGWDGRLKTLNFIINSRHHLETVLTAGERVDGSSLFPFIEAGSSDLYVIPKYRTAFVDPFTEIPTLDIICSFFNKNGEPLDSSPEYILRKADHVLKERTGYELQTMGELEYYVISPKEDLYLAQDQRGYHESTPFTKWEHLRTEAMQAIAKAGGQIKYGHSEVGNFEVGDLMYEQNEIEFLPSPLESAAEQLLVAKWILRVMAYKYGVTISFAPKITIGKAGSGMHIHTRLMKDGKNVMIEDGKLSDTAKKMIAGFLDLSPSLTSFSNINPTSYFRLVPHQEAPTNICWGDRNRSTLVRVPLGWTGNVNMVHIANPHEEAPKISFFDKQTVEYRASDCSADIYLLMAGLAVAARHGLEMEDALKYAERTYVDVNIFKDEHKEKLQSLSQLPTSCWESAEALENQKSIYLQYGIFPERMTDWIVRYLKAFNDRNLRRDIGRNEEEIMKLVQNHFNCG